MIVRYGFLLVCYSNFVPKMRRKHLVFWFLFKPVCLAGDHIHVTMYHVRSGGTIILAIITLIYKISGGISTTIYVLISWYIVAAAAA